jgi:protein SCO1/2
MTRFPALGALAVLLGCTGGEGGRVVGAESIATDVALARPDFTLTDTDGKPFDFLARTAGKLTFLQFGYLNCPDVCPVHMANLGTVIGKLAPSDRMKIVVVFVSVDPDRDSLPALKRWVAAVNPEFIGVTGRREALDAAQKAVGFAPAFVTPAATNSPATVTHAAPVIVFTPDDSAHVMYPFGTRQADWERDIPRLLAKTGSRR